MSPSRVHSQPSPRPAHGIWIKQSPEHDAILHPLPLDSADTWLRPAGCSGLAFRELILPTLTGSAFRAWAGLLKADEIS
jgi:hypothetical protein